MDNSLPVNIDKYDIGKTYYRENEICIFDPIRQILVIETPEEIIRQKFVRYLIDKLEVPKSKIEIEVPMSRFEKGKRGKADIVVYGKNKDGYNIPIMLVECKAPNVLLIDKVWSQLYKYDNIIDAGFITLTNGQDTYAAVYDHNENEYYYVDKLPKYRDLINRDNLILHIDDSDDWVRPQFSKILSNKVINQFLQLGWLGEDTDSKLYPLIINLAGFLHDTRIKFSPIELYGLNIIEDGHRYTTLGNAAGGTWPGDYRYFILKDESDNNQIISISIYASTKEVNDPFWGNRKGHTTLIVAIDDFDKTHSSLQLNIDKYTKVQGSIFTIWHDGTLTIGRNGAAKKDEVVCYIREKDPNLVDEHGKIILGSFDCSKEIAWNQKNTQHFLANIIKYSLLRDQFRKSKS